MMAPAHDERMSKELTFLCRDAARQSAIAHRSIINGEELC